MYRGEISVKMNNYQHENTVKYAFELFSVLAHMILINREKTNKQTHTQQNTETMDKQEKL